MSRASAFLLFASACYGPAKYERQYNEAACARYDECGWLADLGWDSVDACITAHEKLDDEKRDNCGGYARKDAKTCVADLEAASCDSLALGEEPESCAVLCE